MFQPIPKCTGTRREFLWQMGAGFAGLALADLLDRDGFFANRVTASEARTTPLAPRPAHFAAKAKRCIFLFMYGGPSQMDTFDYKPELQKRDGQEINVELRRGAVSKGKLLASGASSASMVNPASGVSDAFPNLAKHMDELCVLKSLYADTFAHGSAMIQMNTAASSRVGPRSVPGSAMGWERLTRTCRATW